MKKILIVDDAPENILVIGQYLMPQYEVLVATSGTDALRIAQAQFPDLILLDIHMPNMDGYQVMHALRADSNTPQVPVIMLSADDSEETQRRVLHAGAQAFLAKPLHAATLLEHVSKLL